ncbi:MAG: HesA/MoeB/ThiF family protein [Candidatus Lokiarchaeota archaeon]|nr:HesA/MoeB/ThiF family protein [Candidatus Lokiarchaeota archaeon]
MEKRYDRLNAINAFGYDIKWESLRKKAVTIAGVGGLGMLAAEILARCGIGTLYLFDMDIVDAVNLNRLGFHPDDLGLPKVDVIAERIKRINPDVATEPLHGDIMMLDNEDVFEDRVKRSAVVLMGMDNLPARMFVNQKCVNNGIVLVDGGTSRSALSGHVQPVIPGKTACVACRGSIASKQPREKGQRCTASLPTTMAIIASLQVQEVLKYLLGFGTLASYMTYNALTGEFTTHQTRPDPACPACKHVQRVGK